MQVLVIALARRVSLQREESELMKPWLQVMRSASSNGDVKYQLFRCYGRLKGRLAYAIRLQAN
jgi:hypothetical protein